MARIAVITDSSADLPTDVAAREGIVVVPVTSGIDAASLASRERIAAGIAERVDSPALPEFAAPAPLVDAFADAFAAASSDYDGAIAVLLSSRLGGVVAAAQAASERDNSIPIEIVDSRSASLGLGFQALRAAELARAGAPLSAIAGELRAATARYHVVFSIESVEHLRRSGQIGRSAAAISEALQLKPLLRIDEGQIVPYERARTRTRAIAELADFVCQLPALERCAVLFATSERDALHLAQAIAADTGLPSERLTVARIGETIAAQVGPGALGVAVVEPDPS